MGNEKGTDIFVIHFHWQLSKIFYRCPISKGTLQRLLALVTCPLNAASLSRIFLQLMDHWSLASNGFSNHPMRISGIAITEGPEGTPFW